MNPVLFIRDGDGDVFIVMPNTIANLNRLRHLSGEHRIFVAQSHDIMIVTQGHVPSNVPKKLAADFEVRLQTVLEPGPDVRGVCKSCEYRKDCPGPLKQAGEILHLDRDDAGVVLLDLIAESRIDECPLFTNEKKPYDGTIRKRDLEALGFDTVASARAFTDSEIEDEDLEMVSRLGNFQTLAEAIDLVGSQWVNNVISDGWRARRPAGRYSYRMDPEASRLQDFFFDPEHVKVNTTKSRIRALNAGASRRELNAYRKENCSRCLYGCERPPWNRNYPNPLTEERLLDDFRPDDEQRKWMSLFMITGCKGSFTNPETGRLCKGFGARPDHLPSGDLGIEVVRRVPDYYPYATLTVDEYLEGLDRDYFSRGLPVLRSDLTELELASINYALMAMSKWREKRFYVFDRPSRNDILGVELYPDCKNIRVWSDTKASDDGCFHYRGNSLSADDRPRFHTDYGLPFAEAIWGWTHTAPYACAGCSK